MRKFTKALTLATATMLLVSSVEDVAMETNHKQQQEEILHLQA